MSSAFNCHRLSIHSWLHNRMRLNLQPEKPFSATSSYKQLPRIAPLLFLLLSIKHKEVHNDTSLKKPNLPLNNGERTPSTGIYIILKLPASGNSMGHSACPKCSTPISGGGKKCGACGAVWLPFHVALEGPYANISLGLPRVRETATCKADEERWITVGHGYAEHGYIINEGLAQLMFVFDHV